MNLFTLTDHDSIEGAETLRGHPEFLHERRTHLQDAQRQ
jgi:hypothetical protein